MGDRSAVILGGGVAGVAAARVLLEAGRRVVVLDKGRGPGGRASTRRAEAGRFDHGAQYFTARTRGFRQLVERLESSGSVAAWKGRFATLRKDGWIPAPAEERWVGTPGMNELVRGMAEGIDIRYGVQAQGIVQRDDRWVVPCRAGLEIGSFDEVVVAVPAPQAADLLMESVPGLAEQARGAVMRPCWSLMAAFADPVGFPWDGVRIESDGPLGWIGRDSSKPGRVRDGVERWVIQATASWSETEIETDPERVTAALLAAFEALVGRLGAPVFTACHRWRYALASHPAGAPCLHEPGRGLAVCGDWLLNARIEAAFESGAAAGRVLTQRP